MAAIFPSRPQRFPRAPTLSARGTARVGVVELVAVDPVCLERPQADLAVRAEGLRPPVDRELVAVAPVPSLGRDQRAVVRDAAQRARDDLLGIGLDARPRVGERRVDEPDPRPERRGRSPPSPRRCRPGRRTAPSRDRSPRCGARRSASGYLSRRTTAGGPTRARPAGPPGQAARRRGSGCMADDGDCHRPPMTWLAVASWLRCRAGHAASPFSLLSGTAGARLRAARVPERRLAGRQAVKVRSAQRSPSRPHFWHSNSFRDHYRRRARCWRGAPRLLVEEAGGARCATDRTVCLVPRSFRPRTGPWRWPTPPTTRVPWRGQSSPFTMRCGRPAPP